MCGYACCRLQLALYHSPTVPLPTLGWRVPQGLPLKSVEGRSRSIIIPMHPHRAVAATPRLVNHVDRSGCAVIAPLHKSLLHMVSSCNMLFDCQDTGMIFLLRTPAVQDCTQRLVLRSNRSLGRELKQDAVQNNPIFLIEVRFDSSQQFDLLVIQDTISWFEPF